MGIFDEMAARYDTPERVEMANAIADVLRPRLVNCAAKSGIDYGCGTGLVGLQLADCFKNLLMVDASSEMIAQVRAKVLRRGLKSTDVLCADFMVKIPPGLSTDVIFLAQVLLHIPDTDGILYQLYRVLNPGGRLMIVDFDKETSILSDKVHNGFVQTEFIGLVKQSGFTDVSAETFYRGKGIFMGRDASLFLMEALKPPA
ncbi:class I SAM-dependent methyltransferase [Ruminococcaceae bacterium OttesenSCG-928-I18]|nr:class I SAM-dependent methyltransferase [Ruminococcaceae bacterium OttesenSCG-928-I18]